MSNTQGDTLLPLFLRKLAEDVENRKVSDDQLQRIGEFYVSYLFHQEVEKDVLGTRSEEDTKTDSMSNEDFRKFMFMGYYVYSQISKGKNV